VTVVDFLSLRQWLIAVGFSAGPLTGNPTESLGLAEDGTTVTDTLSSPDGQAWTLLYSLATGRFSVIASGRRWDIQMHSALA